MNSGFKKTDISGSDPSNVEGGNTSELDKFFDNDSIKANQEMIEGVLNKEENKSLKEGFENFLSKEKNVVKKNAIKLKLSKATDELTIKSIIAEVVEGGYKITDKKSVGGDAGDGENVGDDGNQGESVGIGEKTGDENTEENQNGSLDSHSRQMFQSEEQADQKTEQADQKTEQAKTDKEQVDKQKLREEALKARQDLLDSHQNQEKAKQLDEYTRKEAEKIKNKLPEETKNQLKEKGYDENFINDYILLRVTANEVKKDFSFDKNAVAQFESKVNELSTLDVILKSIDNACKIPDTSLSSFDKDNIAQTRTELFDGEIGNKSLIKVKQSNTESHNYSEVFSNMRDNEIFEKYGKFLEGDLKKCWDKYENNYYGFFNEFSLLNKQKSQGQTLTEEEEMILSLPGIIEGIKKEMDNNTKNMMEELCIISQIKGMYMCMGEGENFSLNKANEIKAEEIDDKNLILTLNGHIDGVDFAIRQNVKDPNGRLQIYQKLARDKDTFVVGGENKFVDSNFILPSQDEIFESIKETVTSGESLANSNNPEDYIKNLQENIMGKIEDKYENTKYVHHYMQEQVKGEKIVDSTLGVLGKISPTTVNDKILMGNISQERNSDLYDFIKILKFNIDNSTDVEKDKLNKCIEKILEITDNYKNNNGIEDFVTLKYPPVIEHYLKDGTWLNGGDEKSRIKLISDLFRYYSENSRDTRANSKGEYGQPSKMIIDNLYRDLVEFQGGGQSETANTWDGEQASQQKLEANNKIEEGEREDADATLTKMMETGLRGV